MWEYSIRHDLDQAQLSAHGIRGWELLAVVKEMGGSTFYFKKPKN